MTPTIDIEGHFSPEALRNAYFDYKRSKTDRFDPGKIRIPMGADGVAWDEFEGNLDRTVANISRRVLNGSYQFYPLRQVLVPKDEADPQGEQRPLAIASIRDALVQLQLYRSLYDSAEAMFSKPSVDGVSFAYRKGRSAPHAALKIWRSFKLGGFGHALDADIRRFFDTLDHERLMHLVDAWVGPDTIARKLIWRYIRTDLIRSDAYPDPKTHPGWKDFFKTAKRQRTQRWEEAPKGVPQGGVLSGMLANLYLHEFDLWVMEELRQNIDLRYYRYADDFVILTRSHPDAVAIRVPVEQKLHDIRLEIHPDKTTTPDINHDGLVFLGFHFAATKVSAKLKNVQKFQARFKLALQKENTFIQRVGSDWRIRLRLIIRYCVNPKILGPVPIVCETCGLPKDRRRNWMAFFAAVVTDVRQLRKLDRWVRKTICKYFRDHYRKRIGVADLRRAGLKSLVNEYYRQRYSTLDLCQCPNAP